MKKILLIFFICSFLLYSYSQTIIVYNTENSELPDNDVSSIYIDENDNTWFGTGSGLAFFNGLNWIIYDASSDINISENDNTVNDIFAQNSNLWIATNSGASTANYNESGLISSTIYNNNNSDIGTDTVSSISIDGTGSVWFGGLTIVSTLLNNIWNFIDDNLLFELYNITTIASTNDTTNFVGTKGGGIVLMYNNEIDGITGGTIYETPWSQLPSDTINTIFIDDTTQWYGTNQGAAFHKGIKAKENWTQYYKEDGLLSDVVYAINKDQNGRVWFGTDEGISILKNDATWTSFTIEDGLSSNKINDIAFKSNGNAWIATDNGVTKLQYIDDTPVLLNTIKKDYINTYPNPALSYINICFYNNQSEYTNISIYKADGTLVKIINNNYLKSGDQYFRWNLENSYGNRVKSGIYVIRIKSENLIINKKVLVI